MSREREALALGIQPLISSSSLTKAQKKIRIKEATHWREVHDAWKEGNDLSDKTLCPRPCVFCWVKEPRSAWDYARLFLSRMGIDVLEGRLCMFGRICEIGKDQGAKVRVPMLSSDESLTGWSSGQSDGTSEGTDYARDEFQPVDELEADEEEFDEGYDAEVMDANPEYDGDVEEV